VEAGGEALEAIPPIADPHRNSIDQDRDPATFCYLLESHWKQPEGAGGGDCLPMGDVARGNSR